MRPSRILSTDSEEAMQRRAATAPSDRTQNARRRQAERSVRRLTFLWHRIDAAAALSDAELLTRVESVSAWCIGQQLFHIALANELCFDNALALARREGMRIKPFEAIHPAARPVLARGTIRRGSAQAPRFVRPPEGGADPESYVDIAVLREILGQGRRTLDEVSERMDAIVSAPDCIPHQLLGDFDAVEWLRFAHVHTVHHLAIVRDLQRALAVAGGT